METTSKTLKSRLLLIVAAFALSLSVVLVITPWSQASADELDTTPPVSGTITFSLSEDAYYLESNVSPYPLLAGFVVDFEDVYTTLNNPPSPNYYKGVTDYTSITDDEITLLEVFAYLHQTEYNSTNNGWANGATITGSAHSTYFTKFWGHNENLTYYVNGIYPLDPSLGPNMGATSDQIILDDGDFVDVQMLDNWDFYLDPLAGYHFFLEGSPDPANIVHEYTATANTPFTVSLGRSWTEDIMSNDVDTVVVKAQSGIPVYGASAYTDTSPTGDIKGYTNANGQAQITFDTAGTYYIWVDGQQGATTSSIVSSPGYAKVVVS